MSVILNYMKSIDQKIDDLAAMVARGFSDIESRMATKDDLFAVESRLTKIEDKLETVSAKVDTVLDRHIGTLRRDHDALAGRVRKLEDLVAT